MKNFLALLALCVVVATAAEVREPLHLKLGASQTTALTRASRMVPLQIGGGHIGPVIPLGTALNYRAQRGKVGKVFPAEIVWGSPWLRSDASYFCYSFRW
jgi:hypothetical protein